MTVKINLQEDFYILVETHEPDFDKPENDELHEKLQAEYDFIQGTHSYEIYKGEDLEPFFSDYHDIWSVDQAIELASQDIPYYKELYLAELKKQTGGVR